MPLYQGSDFWGGKQYQELTELHLPGPSIVIDVRQGSDHDPPLIWDLAVELEDLTTEMRLNQVYRWRYLADCIDLLKLAPLQSDESVKGTTDFILTTRTGQSKSFRGAKELVEELGREHLDRVRNNRIGAVRDRDKDTTGLHPVPANPEQATVRVFFLVDAEDADSLVSAATYAEWMKKWNHEYEEPGRSGRDRRLSTLAICMNADPHRHHPYTLAQYLKQASANRPALDALILMHTYSDDEAFIGGDIQSYQVELILYALLLLSLESLVVADQEMVDNQSLSPYIFTDENGEHPKLPWSIYMMGISSLEYSARWGARWLDYGLVAKIIEIMHDPEEVDGEQRSGRLRREVQERLREWQQGISEIVPDTLTTAVPELQVLDELQGYLNSSPFRGKGLSSSAQDLKTFSQRISQLYVGEGHTLESAIESAPLILWQFKRDFIQLPKDTSESSQVDELYQKLLALQSQAAQLPASLFHGARGMLPRALRQVSELTEIIAEIQEVAENHLDLKEYREQFERQAKQEQEQMERLLKTRRLFSGGKKRQRREDIARRLSEVAHTHLDQVRSVIVARVALALLQEAGLYDPKEKICLYHQRLKQFDKAVSAAQMRASLQQERAYERLKPSLSETQVGVSQTLTWLTLNSRKDLLKWEQIIESFEELYDNLESTPTSLNLLMEWLLRLIGAEKPLIITQQYLSKNKQQWLPKAEEQEKERLQALSTMLVAVLLLLEVVDFDIATLQPLLNQYIDLKDRSSEEPSVLESNILGLQRIVREAMMAQTTRKSQSDKNQKQSVASFALKQEQPIERVLAAWVNNQCAGDPLLARTLDRSGILARLIDSKIKPAEALDDLRERNMLLGYRDEMAGDDRFYLLIAPGETSNSFLKELDLLYSAQIRPVRFPDAEKLIYLHIHRIHQIIPGYTSPANKQLSPNM